METKTAVEALSSLAHEGRLNIFRELVQAGPEGLAAGEIARRVGILPSTLSASLTILANAGLAVSNRRGRSIIYAAKYEQMAEVLGFLLEDCCNGSPAVCNPLLAIVSRTACCPQPGQPEGVA